MKKILFLAALMLFIFMQAWAQSTWMNRSADRSVSLEILKPSYVNGNDVTFTTSVIYLSTHIPINDHLRFIGEVPYSHFGATGAFSGSESSIGNPFVGVDYRNKDSDVSYEFGLRLPLASDKKLGAFLNGFSTDFDRVDAFMPKTVPATLMINHYRKYPSRFVTLLRGGVNFLYYTDSNVSRSTDLYLLYSIHGGYETDKFGFGLGFGGRVVVTGSGGSFDDRSIHQLDLVVHGVFDNIKPGLYLRVPMDELLEQFIDVVWGINMEYAF